MSGRRRSGGRAGRIAERAAPLQVDARPVRPGLPGGRYAPLKDADLQMVYDTAVRLLEDVGMGSPIPEFVDVVTAAGGHVDEHERLRFPRGVVERAIETACKEWVWHGYDDDRSIEVGGDKVHFGTAGAAVLMHDHETNTFRPSTAQDVYDCARLVDHLDNIHFFVRTVVARDQEDARLLDLNTAFAATIGTAKPVGTSFFDRAHVYETVEMYDVLAGGEGEYRKRPFVAANNTFVVPPLRYAEESAGCMVAQVERGHAHQPPVGRTGRCHLSRRFGGVAGPGARRVSVGADCGEPDEPRASVRDGAVALRVGPPDRRDERGQRRGGRAQRRGGPARQLARVCRRAWRRG